MECTECKFRKQLPIKRCKHFELGGDKKKKVKVHVSTYIHAEHKISSALGMSVVFNNNNNNNCVHTYMGKVAVLLMGICIVECDCHHVRHCM